MSGALTWEEEGSPRAVNLGHGRPLMIGRTSGSDIHVRDASVSREQALIEFHGNRYYLTNRSQTNPTLLNGSRATVGTTLADGDHLGMGNVQLQFHDLSVGDGISGPKCSHCGRENSATDKDCWFCGTSLVYAASTLRTRRLVAGRVVSAGDRLDLYEGQTAALRGGAPEIRQAQAESDDGVQVSAAGGRLVQGGEPGRELATGDVIEAAARRYVVIVR